MLAPQAGRAIIADMARDPVLTLTDRGLYCPAGDFFIDPWRPVDRALITHGHADHARPGHARYLATHACLPVMRHRLGTIAAQGVAYGETLRLGAAEVSFHPAGHVPGSAQIRVAVAGEVWVVSGDYKPEPDGLSEAFAPLACHTFITECTFGLPVFRWRPQAEVAAEILRWWQGNAAAGRVSLLSAYALGKAQRLMHMLRDGPGPILCHAAVENTNAVLRAQGLDLPPSLRVTPEMDRRAHPGALVIAPPSALAGTWARRFGPAEAAAASGWMQIRGIRRRRGAGRGFVVSDHADWPGLLSVIRETGAETILATHGYTDVFARYLSQQGWNAQVLATEFSDAGDALDDEGIAPTGAAEGAP